MVTAPAADYDAALRLTGRLVHELDQWIALMRARIDDRAREVHVSDDDPDRLAVEIPVLAARLDAADGHDAEAAADVDRRLADGLDNLTALTQGVWTALDHLVRIQGEVRAVEAEQRAVKDTTVGLGARVDAEASSRARVTRRQGWTAAAVAALAVLTATSGALLLQARSALDQTRTTQRAIVMSQRAGCERTNDLRRADRRPVVDCAAAYPLPAP